MVTGFLGAGKTTLLRHLLLNSGQRLAVLVNEFGEVGIDGELLRSCGFCPEDELDTRLVELANGCLCCTVQDDFLPTMEKLLERADSLDGIVVETSGLALPEPLIAALNWPQIRTRIRLNGVVAVVDGEALAAGSVVANPAALEAQRLADPSLDHASAIDELFAEQLEAADLVLISRADCLSAGEIDLVHEGLAPSCSQELCCCRWAGVWSPQSWCWALSPGSRPPQAMTITTMTMTMTITSITITPMSPSSRLPSTYLAISAALPLSNNCCS